MSPDVFLLPLLSTIKWWRRDAMSGTWARVEGVTRRERARVRGQRVYIMIYSPVSFSWLCGGEEVVDLESTGRLRVEARQERHQSLLSRSLTHTARTTHCCLSGGRSRSPETATEEQGRLKSCRFFSRTTTVERFTLAGMQFSRISIFLRRCEQTLGMSMANKIPAQVQQRCRLTC